MSKNVVLLVRRAVGVCAAAAALTIGAASAAGAAQPAFEGHAAVTPSTATPDYSVAPRCITFSQFKHGNAFTGYHTNVYLTSSCGSNERVKIVMRNGYDSGCIQLSPHEVGHEFTSYSDDGLQPYVDRLEAC